MTTFIEPCIECGKPSTCTRHTQFAGDHPYCKEHGMEQEDYFVDDSYTYWTSKEETLRNIIAGAEQQGDDDKGYELSTHEKYEEFAKKRNESMLIPKHVNPDMIQVRDPDGTEVIRIAADGRIYWKSREVTTDDEFRTTMMELAQRLAGRM